MADSVVVATILPERGHTGVQSHFNALRLYLADAGTACTIVSAYGYARGLCWPTFLLRRAIERLDSARSVWWYDATHYLALRAALRRRLAGGERLVVYAQCPLSARAALAARRGPHQRVVMVVHFNVSQADEWVDKGLLRADDDIYRDIKRREADVLPRLDGVVYVSRFMRDTLECEVEGLASVPSIVVPNFVEPASEAPSSDAGARHLLISVGSLEPRKNQAFLLRVVAAARARGARYRLTLVGDGQDRERLRRLARELDITEQVVFAGFVPDARRLMSAHAAYVHAARLENLPVTLVEAMAYGLPVFAAPVGGIPEILDDHEQGRYWSLDDPSAAADALVDTLSNSAAYARMSHNARRRFAERFEPRRVALRLAAFLSGDLHADAA